MLTESTLVAAIAGASSIIATSLAAILANSARKHSRAARVQVENGHKTNLRDDIDGIRAELRGIRRDVGRNSDRIGAHDHQIERLWARVHPNLRRRKT